MGLERSSHGGFSAGGTGRFVLSFGVRGALLAKRPTGISSQVVAMKVLKVKCS